MPLDELLDQPEQPLALALLILLGGNSSGRLKGSSTMDANRAPAGGERPARPPEMKRRGVSVPDRLLAR